MLAEERRQKIVELINQDNIVKVNELSETLEVTTETIRSDLDKLEQQGVLKRTHGGAVAVDNHQELSFNIRKDKNKKEKKEIAKKAASLIKDGDTVFLDASTSAFYLAEEILELQNVTVITNSNTIVTELSKNEDITVISTGGMLRRNSLSFVGPLTNTNIRNYNANKAFLSCKGVSVKHGATEVNELESETKQNMVKKSEEIYILGKVTAINEVGLSQFAAIEEINKVITTDDIPEDLVASLKELGKLY
ncbi:DeoR family transcriptional regulator [Halanaerobium saccharolyticum]|uniref:DeoR family transcriptional regulator n=1 Tax=Halanaerobium saccharolyticum TaxID=43595 RepID=A0A4R6LRG2_9FIRM|nr:DeoR/GlpR family DNA-binding transcription regulator [Halanaerobium saccharolyticum]TDO90045.1 DeoR family transcriptional regulator [Halanaerobium saccharolyticum]